MAVVRVNKVETTQVAGGAGDVYGFVISVHSASAEFSFVGNMDIDTATLSAADAKIVTDFIALVNAQLLAS